MTIEWGSKQWFVQFDMLFNQLDEEEELKESEDEDKDWDLEQDSTAMFEIGH